MSNTEFAKSGQAKQSEDEYICDEKENCKNSLECKGCYPQATSVSKPSASLQEEFNSDKLDNILYPDGLDWTFEKPTKGKYHTIYIIKKEEEE
tara:strand:+ start:3558 stop:3836 length:279 start_codon:yes stop_codon:yes gene_type:complete